MKTLALHKVIITLIFFGGILIFGQLKFNPRIDKDSLFESVLKSYPDDEFKYKLREVFSKTNTGEKEYLLSVLYDTNYTKQDLIKNFEKNKVEILQVKSQYSELVPKNLIVQTSINSNELYLPKKVISIKVYKIKDGFLNNNLLDNLSNLDLISSNDGLLYGTDELKKVLEKLNWDENVLKSIEMKLKAVNSFSIRNGNPSLINYKKAGLGVLSYKIFAQDLNKQEIIDYNDGCNHIFYKNNIVLVSDNGQDGARGALCFAP